MNSQITLDLENLRKKYSNLLLNYKKATAEYIGYLNEQSKLPCKKYSSDSTGVDQACYDYIWKKSGCGTGTYQPGAGSSWAQSQTLNGLIDDSFVWATLTDSSHREGCYGNSTKYNTSTSPDYNINAQPLVSIQGQSFTGTGSAGQSSATTLQDCMASCATSDTCTGATFVSNKCMIRTGDSPLIPSAQDSHAIIPKGKQLLFNMEDINRQLLEVNNQLVEKTKITEPVYDKTNEETYLKNQELLHTYDKLLEERRIIAATLNEYETLENTENENQIKITKNYYTYILLSILAVAMIAILYKMFGSVNTNARPPVIQSGGDLGENAYYIVFGLIAIVIFANIYKFAK